MDSTTLNEFAAQFWGTVDNRGPLFQVPRLKNATVIDAASPFSYTLQFPGMAENFDAVTSISGVVPIVGDEVLVAILDSIPIILGVKGRRADPVQLGVAASGTTTSTTYTGTLSSGSGPTVNLDMVAGQVVMVYVYARITNSSGGPGHQSFMSWSVSGAETQGASDTDAIESQANLAEAGSKMGFFTAGVTGSHTFNAQYKVVSPDTATFVNRRIVVVP